MIQFNIPAGFIGVFGFVLPINIRQTGNSCLEATKVKLQAWVFPFFDSLQKALRPGAGYDKNHVSPYFIKILFRPQKGLYQTN
jgi:hypothetical protein